MSNLHELLTTRRDELIQRWSQRIANAVTAQPPPSRSELIDHIPNFVDELITNLHPSAIPLPGGSPTAREHGTQRLRLGFDIGEVVREYGLLQSCIIELAREGSVTLTDDEFQILSKCMHQGTADAVTQYAWQRDQEFHRQASQHIGFIAHELRNPLGTARTALSILRRRELAAGGKVVDTLDRSLGRVSELIENALTQAWLHAGAVPARERLMVRDLLVAISEESAMEADHKSIEVRVDADASLAVLADPRMLRSMMGNLMHNALKFTAEGGHVELRGLERGGRVIFEVEDGCGGLSADTMTEMFKPFAQQGSDRSGFGLGLAIARQAAMAHEGIISVRNQPGHGCVMVLDLPAEQKAP